MGFENSKSKENSKPKENLRSKIFSEIFGTAILLATIVGSGIMGERLSQGNAAIALLANSIATGAILITLIITLGPISGSHFNPLVTVLCGIEEKWKFSKIAAYISAQFFGAILGVGIANIMFDLPVLFPSQHIRSGFPLFFSEVIATFGLLSIIKICSKTKPNFIPFVVSAYIVAAYWFTASTSFANPAVTFARSLSDTFAGIRLWDVPLFILAQAIGAAATFLITDNLIELKPGHKND